MNYNNETPLEMIELYAAEMGYIASEDELSEAFDNMLEECSPDFPIDDEPAFNEAFNNWSDALCKDGTIHPLQYDKYTYTKKHA